MKTLTSPQPRGSEPKQPLRPPGGWGFWDNISENVEIEPSSIIQAGTSLVKDIFQATRDLTLEDIAQFPSKLTDKQPYGTEKPSGEPTIGGKTEVRFQPTKEESRFQQIRSFVEQVNIQTAQHTAKEQIEKEVKAGVLGISEEERNKLLHLSGDYRKKNTQTTYHRQALEASYAEMVEQRKQAKKDQGIPQPKGRSIGPNFDLNKVAEGGSQLATTGGGGIG